MLKIIAIIDQDVSIPSSVVAAESDALPCAERRASIIVTSPSIRKNPPFLLAEDQKQIEERQSGCFLVLFKREEMVPRANQSSRLDSQDPPEYQGKRK